MDTNWTVLVRQYFARQDRALLEQAITAAQEQEIVALLTAVQEWDLNAIDRLAHTLHESLYRAGRVEEALTVALLATDLQAQCVEFYNQFPLEQQSQALEFGLRACDTAIHLATLLADQPCAALYQSAKGSGLYHARELEAARAAYAKAIVLREQHRLWLDSSETYYNWGRLEEDEGDTAQVLELFERCVQRCEQGLHQLVEWEHRDLFKGKIEYACLWLIEYYGRLATSNGQAMPERLIGLLESLRQVETLAGFGEAASEDITPWQETFHDLMHGTGELSNLFRARRCALLWIHATRHSVVFVILRPGQCQVEVTDRVLLERFWELFGAVEQAMIASQSRSAVAAHIPAAGEAVFTLLPDGVKTLLASNDYETVFLAPCSTTINLPFEMLYVPEEWQGQGKNRTRGSRREAWPYVGLRRLMPRVHGLGELAQVLKRQPTGKKAVVVGNPLHHGFLHSKHPCPVCQGTCPVCGSREHCGAVPLGGAQITADLLAKELRRQGFSLIPHGGTLFNHSATAEAVLTALANEDLGFWGQMGHGSRPGGEDTERVEYLALAGTDRLLPQQVARLRWAQHPVVHHDCCVTGTTRGRGGGRFDGHPTAALLAGASCVLSSVHALWDDMAAEFSTRLYAKLLRARNPLPLGEALLAIRRAMAKAHHANPLIWATTVLWGNPWARLM